MEVNLDLLNQSKQYVLNNPPAMPAYKPGKSLVTSCYRTEIPGMFVLLKELNRLNFDLPIEIFYRSGELDPSEIHELSNVYPQRVQFKQIKSNAKNFQDRWGNVKGWSTKVHAVIESEWAENFWIDGDNFPIRNCMDLFNDTEYQSKGSLFW